jgi:Transposase family tnp2
MKRKYLMMLLLISGLRQPGNDIDVYLVPLIKDLQKLWKEGVEVYDSYLKEYFPLRAIVVCTVNDYPALAKFIACKIN